MPISYSDPYEKPAADLTARPAEEPLHSGLPKPGLEDIIGAGAVVGSELFSAHHYEYYDRSIVDKNYATTAYYKIKGTKYEPYWNQIDADNDEELEMWKRNIDKKERAYETVQAGGWKGMVAAMAASAISPLSFVPAIQGLNAFKKANTIRKIASSSAAVGALSGGQEAIQGAFEPGKTAEDITYATVGGALLGGVLGGAGAYLWPGEGAVARAFIDSNLKDTAYVKLGDIKVPTGQDANAAVNWALVKERELDFGMAYLGDGKLAAEVAAPTPYLKGPSLELVTSPFKSARRLGAELFENSWILKTNVEDDVPSPVSLSTQREFDFRENLEHHRFSDKMYQQYLDSRNETVLGTNMAKLSGKPDRPMTRAELQREVAIAMQSKDKHTTKEVEELAAFYRQEYVRAVKKMQDSGVPAFQRGRLAGKAEELKGKGAETYFSMVLDRSKVIAKQSEFLDTIIDGLKTVHKMDDFTARAEAQRFLDNALSYGDDFSFLYMMTKVDAEKGVGFIKHKAAELPDEYFREYAVLDAEKVVSHYIAQANRLSRFYSYLKEKGHYTVAEDGVQIPNPKGLVDELRKEFDGKRETILSNIESGKISRAEGNKILAELDKAFNKAREQMTDAIAIALGVFQVRSPVDKFVGIIKALNYITMMGKVVIASLTDLSRPIMRYGLGRTLINGYLSAFQDMATGFTKARKADLAHMNIATDMEMNRSVMQMLDGDEGGVTGLGKAHEIMNRLTGWYSKLNLLSPWTDFVKRIDAQIAQAKMIEDIMKFEKLSEFERADLRHLGFDDETIAAVRHELSKKGDAVTIHRVNNSYISDIDRWDNKTAAEKFAAASIKVVNELVVRGKEGDMPRWAQKYSLAQLPTQFRGYFFTYANKVELVNMQRRDKNVVIGIALSAGLGYTSYLINEALAGREPKIDFKTFVEQGLSRSGVFGLLTDPAFLIYKQLGFGSAGTRYYNDSMIEYLGGATASRAQSLYELAIRVGQGKLDETTAKQTLKQFPVNNLFWLVLPYQILNGDENAGGKI